MTLPGKAGRFTLVGLVGAFLIPLALRPDRPGIYKK